MKFDTSSAIIYTPGKVPLDVLKIVQYGAAFYDHNEYDAQHYYRNTNWKLQLKDGKFNLKEVPYLRGMAFIISDSFTQFLVCCYAVEKDFDEDYVTLICQDVDNLEYLERAKRTDTYKDIFNPDFKGKLPELKGDL